MLRSAARRVALAAGTAVSFLRGPVFYLRMLRSLREMEAYYGLRARTPREERRRIRDLDISDRKRRLSWRGRERVRRLLNSAHGIDIACSQAPMQLVASAREHPGRTFVGVDDQRLGRKWRRTLSALPNAHFVRADALEALELLEPGNGRTINMSRFPYFFEGNDLSQNRQYRRQLFNEAFRAMSGKDRLVLNVRHAYLAEEELRNAGFRTRRAGRWGKGRLDVQRYGSRDIKHGYASSDGVHQLLAKRPKVSLSCPSPAARRGNLD